MFLIQQGFLSEGKCHVATAVGRDSHAHTAAAGVPVAGEMRCLCYAKVGCCKANRELPRLKSSDSCGRDSHAHSAAASVAVAGNAMF
jgi:hypothetical protein